MRSTAIALAALCLAAPAAAQDGSETAEQRTVEGAQNFLTELYQNGGARIETAGYQLGSDWRWTEFPGSQIQMVEGKVEGVKTLGECKSAVTISSVVRKRWRASDPAVAIGPPGGPLKLEIDWSKLTRVKTDAGWMYAVGGTEQVPSGWERTMVYWPGNSAFFMHLDKSDADRATFAMQFLKERCGVKSDSGF